MSTIYKVCVVLCRCVVVNLLVANDFAVSCNKVTLRHYGRQ
jgi:hypothetical protein